MSSWRSITSVAAGSVHTLALSQTGRVFGTGDNQFGQCDVQSWTGITTIAAGARHSLGLRADGTVVAAGDHTEQQCNVNAWAARPQMN